MKYMIAVIMGSDSDLETMRPALKTLSEFGIGYEAHVISAHRTPDRAASFAREAKENGFGVIIAAAGKAAHLAGVLAAHTTLRSLAATIESTLDGPRRAAVDGADAGRRAGRDGRYRRRGKRGAFSRADARIVGRCPCGEA